MVGLRRGVFSKHMCFFYFITLSRILFDQRRSSVLTGNTSIESTFTGTPENLHGRYANAYRLDRKLSTRAFQRYMTTLYCSILVCHIPLESSWAQLFNALGYANVSLHTYSRRPCFIATLICPRALITNIWVRWLKGLMEIIFLRAPVIQGLNEHSVPHNTHPKINHAGCWKTLKYNTTTKN